MVSICMLWILSIAYVVVVYIKNLNEHILKEKDFPEKESLSSILNILVFGFHFVQRI